MVDVETSYISECSVVFASQSGRMWVRYFHKKTIKWVFNLSDQTATLLRPSATLRRSENVQERRQTRTQREKRSPKIQNYKTSALLLRPMRSYYVLTARPPRPLHAYGVSIAIYGLSNGVHRRFRGALTTLMGFLLRVFYVYHDCTATLRRFYHVFTATIKTGQIFGNLILKKDDVKETSFPKPWPWPRHIDISDNLHLAISNLIIR